MNNIKLTSLKSYIPNDVKALLVNIAQHTPDFDVYLGGGYLRDTFTGKPPKDIDVFLAPKQEGILMNNEYIPTGSMVNYRKGVEDIVISSDMEARGLQYLVGLWCTSVYPSKEVQYIVYKNPMTQEQISSDFDMGICQITYNPLTEELHFTENFVKGHYNKVIECFHEYDEDRTISRFERMEKKFPDYSVVGKPLVSSLINSGKPQNKGEQPKTTKSNSGSV